jgi:hypothetical protein
MQFLKTLFWNRDERRLRALWRLVGQLVLLLVIMLPLQVALSLLAFGLLAVQEGIPLDQLASPEAVERLTTGVPQFVMQSPLVLFLSTAVLFVTVVLSVWLAGRLLDRRRFADFGFHFSANWWADLGFGLVLGACLMLLIFLVELAAGWVTVSDTFVTRNPQAIFPLAMVAPLVMFIGVGIQEELLSRGYQLQNMAEGFNLPGIGPRAAIWLAAVLSSAIFGSLHIFNPNAGLVSSFNIFLAGLLLLGAGRLLTGELAIPIGVHITWNFFQGNVLGFPVSGVDYRWATVFATQQHGPELWTGGAFGPEAGLLGVLAMLLGALLITLWVRWRYGRVGLCHALSVAPQRPVMLEN